MLALVQHLLSCEKLSQFFFAALKLPRGANTSFERKKFKGWFSGICQILDLIQQYLLTLWMVNTLKQFVTIRIKNFVTP